MHKADSKKKRVWTMPVITTITLLWLAVAGCEESEEAKSWKAVKKEDSISAYQDYLQRYPQGVQKQAALDRVDQLAFEAAEKGNNAGAYNEYLEKYPTGKFRMKALDGIDGLTFEDAKKQDTIESYRKFLSENPPREGQEGGMRLKALERIDELAFEDAKKQDTRESYQQYIADHPQSKLTAEANGQIEQLALADADAAGTVLAYQSFLETYKPSEENAGKALAKVEEMLGQGLLSLEYIKAAEKLLNDYSPGERRDQVDKLVLMASIARFQKARGKERTDLEKKIGWLSNNKVFLEVGVTSWLDDFHDYRRDLEKFLTNHGFIIADSPEGAHLMIKLTVKELQDVAYYKCSEGGCLATNYFWQRGSLFGYGTSINFSFSIRSLLLNKDLYSYSDSYNQSMSVTIPDSADDDTNQMSIYKQAVGDVRKKINSDLTDGISKVAKLLPNKLTCAKIARKTLLDFNSAVKKEDFAQFQKTLSKTFPVEQSMKKLKKVFNYFITQKIYLEGIAKIGPVINAGSGIDDQGLLQINGTFPFEKFKIVFEFGYIYEDGDWKPVAINVEKMPAGTDQGQNAKDMPMNAQNAAADAKADNDKADDANAVDDIAPAKKAKAAPTKAQTSSDAPKADETKAAEDNADDDLVKRHINYET